MKTTKIFNRVTCLFVFRNRATFQKLVKSTELHKSVIITQNTSEEKQKMAIYAIRCNVSLAYTLNKLQ